MTLGQNNTSKTIDKDSLSDIAVICLIFNEHQQLSIENPLLKKEIQILNELNKTYVESDSLQKQEIIIYKEELNKSQSKIKKLKNTNKKIITGSSIGGIFLFIIGLLL